MVFGVVFIFGVLFFVLMVIGICGKIIDVILNVLKFFIVVGIGFFVVFIGLKNVGLVVVNEFIFVGFGNVMDKGFLLVIFGLILVVVLMVKNVKGVFIISIFVMIILVMIIGV